MTLTKFMARSTWVARAFEWEKLLKCHLKGKARNWQMDRIFIILKKENGPRASSAPALGLNTIIFKHVYWYMQQTQVSIYRTIDPLVYLVFSANCKSIKAMGIFLSLFGKYLVPKTGASFVQRKMKH